MMMQLENTDLNVEAGHKKYDDTNDKCRLCASQLVSRGILA